MNGATMNRWAIRVAVLYVAIVFVLTLPALLVGFGSKSSINLKDTLELYASWQYWLILVLLFVCQYSLLRVPVRVSSRRPVTRGALWPTVLAGGFMIGLLVVGVAAAVVEGVQMAISPVLLASVLGVSVISWIAWAVVFHRAGKVDPEAMARRQGNLLIKGSILELLVAVPMHIFVRQRNECCAGFFTFFGLATGLAVMLFAFGPAVFVLFVQRWKRLHPAASDDVV